MKMNKELYQALSVVERLIGDIEPQDQNYALMDMIKAVARSRYLLDGCQFNFISEISELTRDVIEEMHFEDEEHNPSMQEAIMAMEAWAE